MSRLAKKKIKNKGRDQEVTQYPKKGIFPEERCTRDWGKPKWLEINTRHTQIQLLFN